MDSIEEMKKCILCLHIQLPESVMNDVDKKWNNVRKEIERLKKEKEWLLKRLVCDGPNKESRKWRKYYLEEEMQQALKEE